MNQTMQAFRSRILPLTIPLVLIFCACTTRPGTTNQAIERLFEARSSFEGARSLANVRVTGRGGQSFRATIAIDAAGRLALSALTPFGTTAAQIRIDGDRITLINHLRDTYWQGSLDELTGGHPLADAFRFEGLSYVLAGLPPWSDFGHAGQEIISEDLTRLSSRNLSLIVGPRGIVSGLLRTGQEDVQILFERPGIPPDKVQVSSSFDSTRLVQFEHIALDFEPVALDPLMIPSEYSRADHWESVVR